MPHIFMWLKRSSRNIVLAVLFGIIALVLSASSSCYVLTVLASQHEDRTQNVSSPEHSNGCKLSKSFLGRFRGESISLERVQSYEDCCTECLSRSDCIHISYRASTMVCRLFTSIAYFVFTNSWQSDLGCPESAECPEPKECPGPKERPQPKGYLEPKPHEGQPLHFNSQYNQDKYLYENFFSNTYYGSFVEMGSHDGVEFTNTKFFEDKLGWNGVCVEPSPNFKKLIVNRPNCRNFNVAIGNETTRGTFVSILAKPMLSGIEEFMDWKHLRRIRKFKQTKSEIDIISFEHLLELSGLGNHINYFSLDVEGGECTIIQGINLNVVKFDVLTIENNYKDNCVWNTLEEFGYVKYRRLQGDDLYVRQEFLSQVQSK